MKYILVGILRALFRYLPEALVNFVALMGWTPPNDKEILTMDDLISSFDLESLNKSGCAVDENKVPFSGCSFSSLKSSLFSSSLSS